ncbi:hypothetical protein D3C87_1724440 [compost metagenome]
MFPSFRSSVLPPNWKKAGSVSAAIPRLNLATWSADSFNCSVMPSTDPPAFLAANCHSAKSCALMFRFSDKRDRLAVD